MINIPDHISRLYIDTNIFIYLLEANPTFSGLAAQAIEMAGERGISLVTSEIAVCECRVGAYRRKDQELIDLYEAFFDEIADELEIVPMDSDIIWNAPKLAGSIGLKIVDSLHVSTALVAGCDGFLTNDYGIPSLKDEMEVIVITDTK